jgi:SAM-dependent methyltransferase
MRTTCRISGLPLTQVADFGNLYVSDFFPEVRPDALRSPLRLGIGQDSGLLQLMDTVERDSLYRQYWYASGTNATMTRQLADIVAVIPNWVRLRESDVVLDIGCNDGTLLRQYPAETKVVKVGIDPAVNLAEQGRAHCDLHANDYFTSEVFLPLTGGRRAKVITSIAMFYDLDDPSAFVEDIRECLADDGIWIVQMSYTPLMMTQNAFDNVIHEHLEYYSLLSVDHLVRKHGLKILDVEFNDTNAGSFRLVITPEGNSVSQAALFNRDIGRYRYESVLSHERHGRFDDPQVCVDFMARVASLKAQTLELLNDLKRRGKKVFGYGASTKGNTLLQYYGIGPDLVQGVAERQERKYGLLCAGSWIPIFSEAEVRAQKPDYMLVLPWHFINEFVERERDYLRGGGRFIVPLPELKVIGG